MSSYPSPAGQQAYNTYNNSSPEYYNDSNGYTDDKNSQLQRTLSAKSDSTLITSEIVLNRVGSGKKNIPAARGDAVKKKLELDKMEPSIKPFSGNSSDAKRPITTSEKFQAWMINEGTRAILFAVWIIVHALVFGLAFLNFFFSDNLTTARNTFGITYPIARSAALVLHLDAAMILFPVCRNLVSLLRNTPLNNVIPFDKNITFHKAIGWSILFFTMVHVAAHWVNFARAAMAQNGGVILWLKLNFLSGPGATGYVMLVCLLVMIYTALEKNRRPHFNRFWYLHHLFIPFFGAWAFHGAFCMIPTDREPKCGDIAVFWKYWLTSGAIYIAERLLREVRSKAPTYISKVILHPSKVLEIQIKKDGIRTQAGQYVFINCPEVSRWEWHPFTLTSAPEEEYISVHIRIVGDFTEALAKTLGCDLNEKQPKENKRGVSGINISTRSDALQKSIRVDGPFGSASEDVFKFEVAILVGAGIGVTPFASILKSIWYRVNYPRDSTKLRKAYFFWICRDYRAFEWFQSLLAAIEEQDLNQFIEIQIYLTGRLSEADIGNIMMNDDGNVVDAITGLRAPTHYGRPDWDKIYNNMRDLYPATDIGVFFCGPKPLGRSLHTKCNLWSQGFEGGTRFYYGKENF